MKRLLTTILTLFVILSCFSQTKVKIYPKIIRDITGYSSPQGDPNKPSGFFSDSSHIDPLNGVTSFTGGSDAKYGFPSRRYDGYFPQGNVNASFPGKAVYYPGNRGLRLIFDFTGLKDVTDISKKVTFTDLSAFESVFDAGDTLYLYNFDTAYVHPVDERWKYLARPDSFLTPFAKIVTHVSAPSGQWTNTSLSQSCRYILVRIVLKDRGSYKTIPDFSELVFYGSRNYNPATVVERPKSFTGVVPSNTTSQQTYKSFVGTNLGNGFDTLQLAYDNNIRVYGSTSYWDRGSSNSTTASATFTFDFFPDIGPTQYPFFKRTGKRMWWSIKGASSYLNTVIGTQLNIDTYMSDPENPMNYTRDAKFYFNYAAKFGAVPVSTSRTAWTGDAGYPNGQNTINQVENGNEEDYTMTTLTYWARSAADYDGYESRMGTNSGVKNADPNFKLIMAGLVEIDSARIDQLAFFSKSFRTDGKFVFDYINIHHYARTTDTLGYAPGSTEQIGSHGESPELDSIYYVYNKFANACYNYIDGDTSIKILNTEYGYGNWGTPPATANEAAYPWDLGNVPSITGYDSLHLKAVLMERSELIMPFTPFIGYNEFFFHNSNGSSVNSYLLFATYGRVTFRQNSPPFSAQLFYPWWYHRACMVNFIGNYYPDAILSGNGDQYWLERWRSVSNPANVCFVTWKGSYNGSTLAGKVINVGGTGTVLKKVAGFNNLDSTGTTVPIVSGNITVTVREQPTYYFVTPASLNQAPISLPSSSNDTTFIIGPTLTLNSTGSNDPDGTIASYLWTKISGPNITIQSPGSSSTIINGLTVGIYVFNLMVTDNLGLTSSTILKVTVLPTGSTNYNQKANIIYESGNLLKSAYNVRIVKNSKGQVLAYLDYNTNTIIPLGSYLKIISTN